MPVNVEVDGNAAYEQLMSDIKSIFSSTKEPKTLQTSIYNRTSGYEIHPYWTCLGSTKCFPVQDFAQDMDISLMPPDPDKKINGEVEVCAYEGSTRIVTGNAFFIEVNDGSTDPLAREIMLCEIYSLVSKDQGGNTVFVKATPIYGCLLDIPGSTPIWEPFQKHPNFGPKSWYRSYASVMLQSGQKQAKVDDFVARCYDDVAPSVVDTSTAETTTGHKFNIAAEITGRNQCSVDVYIWDGSSATPPRPINPD
jgi:hypothetical protein